MRPPTPDHRRRHTLITVHIVAARPNSDTILQNEIVTNHPPAAAAGRPIDVGVGGERRHAVEQRNVTQPTAPTQRRRCRRRRYHLNKHRRQQRVVLFTTKNDKC